MKIVTIDTSYRSLVGLVEEESGQMREVARELSADSRHHAETLTPMVASVCGSQRPDLIVAGTGPAAFTGLRAGLMTARALARGWQVPLIGVSSLEVVGLVALAQGLPEVVAAIDARRKELFVARMVPLGPDDVSVLAGPEIIAPADLPAYAAGTPIASPHPTLYPQLEGVEALCEPLAMARLALSHRGRVEAGEAVDISTEPQYLRRPDIHGGAPAQPHA